MKININFDWAFITSVFTIFLYWCGYWYNYGYVKYFEYSINAFDIPIPSMVMDGLIVGFDKFFYLLTLFIIVSLTASVTLNGWKQFFQEIFSNIIFIILFLYHLCWNQFIHKRIVVNVNYKQMGKAYRTLYIINEINKIIKKNKFYSFINESDQSRKVDERNVVYSRFQFSFVIHYLLLVFLLVGILKFFDVGNALINKGKLKAQEHFLTTLRNNEGDKFPKVKIKDSHNEPITYYLTDLCLSGSCLITDVKGNASIHDLKGYKYHPLTLNIILLLKTIYRLLEVQV